MHFGFFWTDEVGERNSFRILIFCKAKQDYSDGSQEKMGLICYLGQLLQKVEQNHGDYILKVHFIHSGNLILFLGKLMGQKHWK